MTANHEPTTQEWRAAVTGDREAWNVLRILPNHYWFCNVDRYILNVGSWYRYQRNIIGDIEHWHTQTCKLLLIYLIFLHLRAEACIRACVHQLPIPRCFESVVVRRPCLQHAVSTAAHYLGSTLSCWFCSALVSREPWASRMLRARSRKESKVKLLVSLHTKVQIKFPCLRILKWFTAVVLLLPYQAKLFKDGYRCGVDNLNITRV